MKTKTFATLVLIISMQGPARAIEPMVADFNSMIGDTCVKVWSNLGKDAKWDPSQLRIFRDNMFTYEKTPANNFITCYALNMDESSSDYGAWQIRFGTAELGKNITLSRRNSATGNWDVVD